MPEAYAVIEAKKADFPVSFMCEVLGVSRSGYYAWRKREPSKRVRDNERLTNEIVKIYTRSRRTYGSPRITRELEAGGLQAGRKRVARLMANIGLSARPRPKHRYADAEPEASTAGNVLARRFDVDEPDRVWVSDITYIWTAAGWTYLAVIIDLYSRRVVGKAMAEHMRAELVLEALYAALGSREPSSEGLLLHSDQGAQFKALRVRQALEDAGIRASMSRRGNCWDNAVAESFFATLKREHTSRKIFLTHEEAKTSIAEWIEVFYNGHRRHSTVDYCSPVEYEQRYYQELEEARAA